MIDRIYRQEIFYGDNTLFCYFLVYINVQKYVFDDVLILEPTFN